MKRILYILFAVVVLIQFIPVNRSVPTHSDLDDLLTVHPASTEVKAILLNACYDCHSYDTRYPWYSRVYPISQWMQHHVNEGREQVNFSVWGAYDAEDRNHAMEEVEEVLTEGEMPLKSYTLTHSEARLTKSDRQRLLNYFRALTGGQQSPARHSEDHEHHEENED